MFSKKNFEIAHEAGLNFSLLLWKYDRDVQKGLSCQNDSIKEKIPTLNYGSLRFSKYKVKWGCGTTAGENPPCACTST